MEVVVESIANISGWEREYKGGIGGCFLNKSTIYRFYDISFFARFDIIQRGEFYIGIPTKDNSLQLLEGISFILKGDIRLYLVGDSA